MAKSGSGEMPEKGEESTNARHLGRQMAEPSEHPSFSGETTGIGAVKAVGERPDLRVVQVEYDTRLGKSVFKDVGALWRNTSKNGNEFYTMKIGKLKLLVFPNNKE